MAKKVIYEDEQNLMFPKKKGLQQDFDNAEKLQEIECPNCHKDTEFYPDLLVWDVDDDFEFCEVTCPECSEKFEICADANDLESTYTFFSSY